MFRLWAKLYKDNKLLQDFIAYDTDYSKSRTQMILSALEVVCHTFDLSNPIWLESNIRDFKLYSKTRFQADNFIESTDFDYLEIEIIEE